MPNITVYITKENSEFLKSRPDINKSVLVQEAIKREAKRKEEKK